MKRPILIIVGAILVFILIIVWLYVLFFSSSNETPDTFTNLNLGNTEDTSIIERGGEETLGPPTVNISDTKKLKQLTTINTIGYQEVLHNASSSVEILYVEAGTGHVFSINSLSGEEKRISKTTVPHSQKAVITPDGRYIFIQSGSGSGSEYMIGKFSSTTDEISFGLAMNDIISFSKTTDNRFLYATQYADYVIVSEHDPETNIIETLFTVPFRAVTIAWGDSASDSHLFYPKTSSRLDGFLYQVKKGKVARLPIDGYGLSASGNSNFITYSKQTLGQYETFIFNQEQSESTLFDLDTIPEKCIFSYTSSSSVCAISLENLGPDSPDSWYHGSVSYSDDLWEIDNEAFSATLLVNTLHESGRELDITRLSFGKDNSVYFINKNDSTLWVYDATVN